jgi:hypothetical protein
LRRHQLRVTLSGLLALAIFWVTFVLVSRQPVINLDRANGLYPAERGDASFRWTSSQAEFPLSPHTGPTRLTLVLSTASLPRGMDLPVVVESDAGTVATVALATEPRTVPVVLAPGATFVRLRTSVSRPALDDWRWLGVQVLQLDATASGISLTALRDGLLLAIVGVAVLWLLVWAQRRGYGSITAITLLGIALRLLWIADSPPLAHRDELVSLVDAWNIAQTGRDHLGHLLPIAAFEAFGDWISPMLTYLLIPWMALFGPDPLVARVVVALFGALAIPAIYGLAQELRMPVAAVCAALVVALSPWQIFLSRIAIPPALVATSWSLCLWAAVRFVTRGRRRDAFVLAAAGLALYAYPTMKLAVPLLLALAVALAVVRHGWRAATRWRLPALALGVIWLPFLLATVLNPASAARLQLVVIRAASFRELLALWWQNYTVYFGPSFYYSSDGVSKIVQAVPGHGMALPAERVLLAGVAALPVVGLLRWRRGRITAEPDTAHRASHTDAVPVQVWLLLVGAVLIAPLPASLTVGNPHAFRAATLAPLYALLVGVGAALEWQALCWLPGRTRVLAQAGCALVLLVTLAWQSSAWFTLLDRYPRKADATWFYADGELDTMRRVIDYAPQFDEIRIDTRTVGRPYMFLLAAQVLPPAEAQTQLTVERQPPLINSVTRLGRYVFADFVKLDIPTNLQVLEAVPTRAGRPGYLLQEWRQGGRRLLIVRGMTTKVASGYSNDPTSDPDGP